MCAGGVLFALFFSSLASVTEIKRVFLPVEQYRFLSFTTPFFVSLFNQLLAHRAYLRWPILLNPCSTHRTISIAATRGRRRCRRTEIHDVDDCRDEHCLHGAGGDYAPRGSNTSFGQGERFLLLWLSGSSQLKFGILVQAFMGGVWLSIGGLVSLILGGGETALTTLYPCELRCSMVELVDDVASTDSKLPFPPPNHSDQQDCYRRSISFWIADE